MAACRLFEECRTNGWPTAIDTFQMTLKSRCLCQSQILNLSSFFLFSASDLIYETGLGLEKSRKDGDDTKRSSASFRNISPDFFGTLSVCVCVCVFGLGFFSPQPSVPVFAEWVFGDSKKETFFSFSHFQVPNGSCCCRNGKPGTGGGEWSRK